MKKILIIIISIIFWIVLIFGIVRLITNKNIDIPINQKINIEIKEDITELKEDLLEKNINNTNNKDQKNTQSYNENNKKDYNENKKNFESTGQNINIEKDQYDILFEKLFLSDQDWGLENEPLKFNVSDYVSKSFIEHYYDKNSSILHYFIEDNDNLVMDLSYDIYNRILKVLVAEQVNSNLNIDSNMFYLIFKFDFIKEDDKYKIDDLYLVADSRVNNIFTDSIMLVDIIWELYKPQSNRNNSVFGLGKEFYEKFPNGKFLGELKEDLYSVESCVINGVQNDNIEQFCNVKLNFIDKEKKNTLKCKYYKMNYELNDHYEIKNIIPIYIRTTEETSKELENLGPTEGMIEEETESTVNNEKEDINEEDNENKEN